MYTSSSPPGSLPALPPMGPPEVLYTYKLASPYPARATSLPLSPEGSVEETFLLTTLLGKGGFSKVYRCQSRQTDKLYAAKVVKKQNIMELDANALLREIRILELLQGNDYVLHFETAVETPSRVYIITELLGRPFCYDDGRDVPPFQTELEASEVLRQMFRPIEYLHSHGIVHRDVKPENFLLNNGDDLRLRLKLIDFGMADYEDNIRQNPLWLGTLQYQSPEMVSQQVYDRKIDMWALGVISYLLLAKKLPFYDYERKNRFIIIEKIKEGKYDLVSVSEEASEFIAQLLCLDPVQRSSSTEALCHPWLQSKT